MKPHVICHMMSSVDGRLDCDRYTEPHNRKTFDEVSKVYFDISLRYHAQAIMLGRKTIQKHYFTQTFQSETSTPITTNESYVGNLLSNRFTIIVDPKGKTLYEDDKAEGENLIAVLSEQVSQEYIDHLRCIGISYLFAGEKGDDMKLALETLRVEFGIEKILLEGGGYLNGTFLKDRLIDELSLLIYPGIDGLAGMATIFDYVGETDSELPAKGQTMELLSSEVLSDGIVWLRYQFHKPGKCCCMIDY